MPFAQDSTLEKAITSLGVTATFQEFVVAKAVEVSAHLRDDIDFMVKFVGLPRSEQARRENLIYPMLKEVWRHFPEMQLWSHEPLSYDADLSGIPDYFLTRRSPLASSAIHEPYLLIAETKKDDFDWGWGQCLAGMIAAQKLNPRPITVHGIVTNGRNWEFGKLEGNHFTQDLNSFNWLPLEAACGVIYFVFEQCRLQLAAYAGAA